ncbi:MAG: 16S rRNA (adenine(1518)-N(6)/adenine(1519)-N(6))-dimethyltransferase RsmA [Candidatus Methylopumilus sp.]|nr:16S rRNA (adenine(1518)-N(6)/adenine(1519)-N(6))-dimethyltransferase RsmA [Candidatus Methylopumilus sp.]
MKYIAKKKFGQNFLKDTSIIYAIIQSINPLQNDLLIEIGPGLGALTKALLEKTKHLFAIELDRDIVNWMKNEYSKNSITIFNEDVLNFNFHQFNQKIRIVGNLPYNISTPILFKCIENIVIIKDLHFMLQKEVVDRMIAIPSSSAYGRLSVMLQYYFRIEHLVHVPKESFEPEPKVESSFVRLIPYETCPFIANNIDQFGMIVKEAFSQRRKTIRNTLKAFMNENDFEKIDINSQLRAENLSVSDFVKISNYLD